MPEPTDPTIARLRQSITDEVQLNLLVIGYWISAGLYAFMSLIGLFYAGMGTLFFAAFETAPVKPGQQSPPEFVKWFFIAFGVAFFLFCVVLALLKARTAVSIKARRSRVFCMVVAGLSCISIPWGTALGVGTFIVLGRRSVVALFEGSPAPPAS